MHRSSPAKPGAGVTQDVYERMRADLLACRVMPGARLKINESCQALCVDLSAVRETLSRSTSEGLVVSEPQRGFRVAPISADERRDLTAVTVLARRPAPRAAAAPPPMGAACAP